jgi:hypothetical protein
MENEGASDRVATEKHRNCSAREKLRRNLSNPDQWSVKVPVPQPSITQITCA